MNFLFARWRGRRAMRYGPRCGIKQDTPRDLGVGMHEKGEPETV
jgi:hypothetical protein